MKKILLFITILILHSCSLAIKDHETAIIPDVISGEKQSSSSPKINITWTSGLVFPDCKKITSQNGDTSIEKFLQKVMEYASLSQREEYEKYTQAIASWIIHDQYYSRQNWSPHFGMFVEEYCTTGDGKYIFYSSDKVSPSFWRYDAGLGTIEEALFRRKYFNDLWWFGDFWAFWKRDGDVIMVESQMNYPWSIQISPLKKEASKKYCDNWLTPGGKKAKCSYRVRYEFNFIKNTFTEKNICSFYLDDANKKQALEACFDVTY